MTKFPVLTRKEGISYRYKRDEVRKKGGEG
jgi:hypothetical protein